ncbi:MAG: hypothetical protein ABSF88_09190 [Candidatus Aminicenantales bacterium]
MNKKRVLVLVVGILVFGLLGYELFQIRSIKSQIEDMEWRFALQEKSQEDTITTDVGTIQFLKRGYSIHIESARFMAEGLYLKGYVGNPLNIWVSNLTLKFVVTKPLYEYKDQFYKTNSPYFFWFGAENIGDAQTSPIVSLLPSKRAPFEVTIPNVKQTKEGLRIAVSFTGERYSYLE